LLVVAAFNPSANGRLLKYTPLVHSLDTEGMEY
jgi:hypothetical protein